MANIFSGKKWYKFSVSERSNITEVPSSGDQFPPVETYVSGPGEVFNLQVTTDVNQNHDWEHHVCWPISNWSRVLISVVPHRWYVFVSPFHWCGEILKSYCYLISLL